MISLRSLDLSDNFLNSSVHVMSGLLSLKLSYNNFNHIRHIGLWKQCHLKLLRVDHNHIQREIGPSTNISECSQYAIEVLDLSWNELNGSQLPESFGKFKGLRELNLEQNQLMGPIHVSIGKLTALKVLYLNDNQLTSFIPISIGKLINLEILGLEFNKLTGPIPTSIGRLASLQKLSVSSNLLNATITSSMGQINKLIYLDVSNNLLEGVVSETHFANLSMLKPIPESLYKWTHLEVLDLSKIWLSGKIPRCLGNLINLKAMVFYSNELSGVIPNFLGNMSYSLTWLNLNNNSLRGELLISLEKFYDLRVLDLGDNELSGSIPKWIGDQLCHLILDIAKNNITREIPRCFKKLSGMIRGSIESVDNRTSSSNLNIIHVMKGVDLEYTTTLQFVVNMDLSSNKLVGKIPEELTTLAMLVGLNLSHNNLSGGLPDTIGIMKAFNSLDFSVNKLTKMIPPSMASLTFLSYLNLSHNNLSGRIPIGNQLQTLGDPSIYAGNRDLCGVPLSNNCSNNKDQTTTSNGKYEEVDEPKRAWFYFDIACGFATGFWCVIGVLLLRKRWRHKLFVFSKVVMDKIHVAVAVRVAKIKRGREAL
ncbi:leucine-rich repeat protein [Tanacetum coccineum]